MKPKMKIEAGEPVWINNPRWGWLPDECPLFERRFRSHGFALEFLNALCELDRARVTYSEVTPHCIAITTSNYAKGEWTPLTTTARELLAALTAEELS